MNARATRFPLFDSLRAIAALAIFGTHAYFVIAANAATPLRQYATRLDVGVYVFFAISGFLLYRPFVRARLGEERSPAIAAYGWRRLLRIGPAYWIALTIVAVWLNMSYVAEPGNAAWLYLFGQSYKSGGLAIGGLPQAWSLCVEAAFYLFLPIWAFAMRSLPARTDRGRLRTELTGLAALALAGFGFAALAEANGAVEHFDRFPLHLTLPCYLEVFAVGMCIAVLSVWYEERELPGWLRPVDRFPGLPWAVALLAFWAVSTRIGLDGHDGESVSTAQYLGRTALYTVVALGVVLPAVFGDQARGLVRRLLANRALLWVGLISYSFFLYHWAVVIQVERWNLPVGGLIALVGSLVISAASYYAIERPAIGLKRLVKPHPEPAPREAIAEPAPVRPARVTHAG
jgi:peptidoglycan/LPS O-acetylase OafA/YrhL